MKDALGDRMKMLEKQESGRIFLPLLPICARLDGRSFSRFTKGMKRPYDPTFTRIMVETTRYLVEETNACIGYTQSDEISLVYYSDKVESQVFFDGRIQKMNSVLASMCSVFFNITLQDVAEDLLSRESELRIQEVWQGKALEMPIFDCRVWTVPNQVEACNNLLWREADCFKNAVSMSAREYYSDKELFKKNGSQMQEMMFKKGMNFNDYPSFFKRGTYIQRRKVLRKFTANELLALPPKHKAIKNPDLMVERTEVKEIDMPPFSKVINRVGVVFNGEEPKEAV